MNRSSLSRSGPPSPPAVPHLGHVPMLARDVLGYLRHVAGTYGDVVALDFGRADSGRDERYFVFHPRDIEFAHVHSGRLFDKGYRKDPLFDVLLGNGLLTSEGDFWLRQRRLAQPAFHKARIEKYATVMVSYAQNLLSQWEGTSTRDVHRDMMALTLDIVTKTLTGSDPGDATTRVISDSIDTILFEYDQLQFGAPRFVPLLGRQAQGRLLRALQDLEGAVSKVIHAKREGGQDTGDLLSMLIEARDDDGAPMTERQLLDEAKTLISAGHETTANTLSWTFALLAQHPSAESRLHAELDEVLGNRSPTLHDLPNLPFLNAVVKETLRLYPPAWIVRRVPREDWQVDGHLIPAGSTVLFSQAVVHRDPRWWHSPNAFLPQRWLEPNFERSLPKYAYFPFGGGPRVCIGQSFAQMETALLLAVLAKPFRLRLTHPPRHEVSITLRPKGHLVMTLHARR